jgi:hypothetical protein
MMTACMQVASHECITFQNGGGAFCADTFLHNRERIVAAL